MVVLTIGRSAMELRRSRAAVVMGFGRVWEEMGRDRLVGRSPEALVEAGGGEMVVLGRLEVAMSGDAWEAARLALIPRRRDRFCLY